MPLLLMPTFLRGFFVKRKPLLFFYYFLFWLLIFYICFCAGYVFFENSSLWQANWIAWQTFTTVGYGDHPPITIGGQLTVMIFGSKGIVFMGAIFSSIIEIIIERMNKRRFGLMLTTIKGGYIAVNWMGQAKFSLLIENIRAREPDVGLIIIDERIDELPPEILAHGNIEFVKGSITTWETYKKAMINYNQRIYVFPQSAIDSSSDATTSKIVELLETEAEASIKIVAYLIDSKNSWMFNIKLPKTTILLEHIEVMVGVQEMQDDGTGKATQIAMSNSIGVDTQTKTPIKSVGIVWRDFIVKFNMACRKFNISVRLFGIMGEDRVPEICPNMKRVIKKNDRILIITNQGFDWDDFEKKIITF